MDNLGRLLLRFILVPLGVFAAATAEAVIVFVAFWQRLSGTIQAAYDDSKFERVVDLFDQQFVLMFDIGFMVAPIFVGILIAEVFAIRSWIFHVLNCVVSAWVGWQVLGAAATLPRPLDALTVVAAGIAGGFAYWAVAGFSAGFWKPVFRRDPDPNLPATPQ